MESLYVSMYGCMGGSSASLLMIKWTRFAKSVLDEEDWSVTCVTRPFCISFNPSNNLGEDKTKALR